jgi:hypothetical protein
VAKKIQDGERAAGNSDFQGFAFEGKASKSVTCNAPEWMYSYRGRLYDRAGQERYSKVPDAAAELVQHLSYQNSRGEWRRTFISGGKELRAADRAGARFPLHRSLRFRFHGFSRP